jgi:hypothetical protein
LSARKTEHPTYASKIGNEEAFSVTGILSEEKGVREKGKEA